MCNEDNVFDVIRDLGSNWNGFGAAPFNDAFVDSCERIAKCLSIKPFVAPTARNSIQFEYDNDGDYLEFELFEDFKCSVFRLNKDNSELHFTILDVNSEILNIFINNLSSIS